MELSTSSGGDWLLLVGRCCLALVFAASASSKFRRAPAEIKVLANLHIPAPPTVELLVGVCETVGVIALVLRQQNRTIRHAVPVGPDVKAKRDHALRSQERGFQCHRW